MATYELISSVTVGSGGQANIEFASIPATFTDLVVLASLRTANTSPHDTVRFQLNSSASNFTIRELNGDGASAGSGTRSDGYFGFTNADTSTANSFSNTLLYIPNYRSSNFKSFSIDKVSEQNTTTAYAELIAGLWSDTATITNIKLIPASASNLMQYSTAYLYGISNA